MDEIWNRPISEGPQCALIKEKCGKLAREFRPRVPKRVLYFLVSRQHGLSAIYPAPISTIFETIDVNRFPHAYTGKKIPFSEEGVFHVQNSPKYGTLGWGVCDRAAARTAQLWVMAIILGASRHLGKIEKSPHLSNGLTDRREI